MGVPDVMLRDGLEVTWRESVWSAAAKLPPYYPNEPKSQRKKRLVRQRGESTQYEVRASQGGSIAAALKVFPQPLKPRP
jgi:hypothetical protein